MKGRRFGIVAVSLAVIVGAAITAGRHAGLRLNFTDSAPHGLWFVRGSNPDTVKRGQLVEICPPQSPLIRLMSDRGYLSRGDCPGDIMPLLKPVSAVAGDTVQIATGALVRVNGATLPNTRTMPAIPAWPAGTYTVKAGQIWVFSSYSAGSFDSRYFGPVSLSGFRGQARPLVVAGNVEAISRGVIKQ
ncbi:conjugative transfer signal peptidase TraF [Klebsiella pneumoniae]|nr:conjugative transfer signal peptidase TraF [Salmonella enterica subsp. enterica serovar Enteritidis]EMB3728235.1 conjugative transfer signal peptidase TraF [Escherichia coli]HAO0780929.1 conjugative transfer signal peptidase TraF [Escherichia coli]